MSKDVFFFYFFRWEGRSLGPFISIILLWCPGTDAWKNVRFSFLSLKRLNESYHIIHLSSILVLFFCSNFTSHPSPVGMPSGRGYLGRYMFIYCYNDWCVTFLQIPKYDISALHSEYILPWILILKIKLQCTMIRKLMGSFINIIGITWVKYHSV